MIPKHIKRMLASIFSAETINRSIIDHGDPDAIFMTPPLMMGSSAVKPPASLERFRSGYGGPRYMGPWLYEAPNGEGVIDVQCNRLALCNVASLEFWKQIEQDALRAHAQEQR